MLRVVAHLFVAVMAISCSKSAKEGAGTERHNEEDASAPEARSAPLDLPIESGPSCDEVAGHLAPIMSPLAGGMDDKTLTDNLRSRCESEWAATMRTCLLAIDAPMGLIQCDSTMAGAECDGAFERLTQLASNANKSDPTLDGKRAAFTSACTALSPGGRKCLLEAKVLDEFKACSGTELVAHTVASDALDWTAPPIPGLTEWYVQEETSRMDDTRTVVATRLAAETIQGSFREERPALLIRCVGKKLDVYVSVGMQVQNEGLSDYRTTRIRLDDDKAVKWKAFESTSGDALFLRKPAKLIELLRGKHRMLFEFTPYQRTPTNVEFKIDGIDEVLPKFSACGVGGDKSPRGRATEKKTPPKPRACGADVDCDVGTLCVKGKCTKSECQGDYDCEADTPLCEHGRCMSIEDAAKQK